MEGTIYQAKDVVLEEKPKQKMRFRVDWVLISLFVVGFVIVWGWEYVQAQLKKAPVMVAPVAISQLTPTPTPLSLKPPSEALSAALSATTGDVKFEGRDMNAYGPATEGAKLVDGDKLKTGLNGTARVDFEHYITLKFGNGTEMSFSNLIPKTFLIQQKSGTIDYTVDPSIANPLSIRSGFMLSELSPGSIVTLTMGKRAMSLAVASGSAKLGMDDRYNVTQVYKVTEKQTATINLTNRTVSIK